LGCEITKFLKITAGFLHKSPVNQLQVFYKGISGLFVFSISGCFNHQIFVNLNGRDQEIKIIYTMDNLLLKYMEYRFQEPMKTGGEKQYPFITISREFGCPSKLIAKLLTDELNCRPGKKEGPKWEYINKEVLAESAKELGLDPKKIQHLFRADQLGIMDDILASFSQNYKSTHQIRKTIHDVIKAFSERGNIILVGRGSVAITLGKPNSLHVRFQAPFDWRIDRICEFEGVSKSQAISTALDIDKKRAALIELFLGRKPEPTLYDVIFNCKTLPKEEIVHAIIKLMEFRKMI
jgi:cytidylate kinase